MDVLRRARRIRHSAYRSASQQKLTSGANVAGRGTLAHAVSASLDYLRRWLSWAAEEAADMLSLTALALLVTLPCVLAIASHRIAFRADLSRLGRSGSVPFGIDNRHSSHSASQSVRV
jgi:hypothetical protein